ncbi:hypothetical protein [Flectobacillus major]|uniref:hypothetical protein n=1 Tax=Flectobacillus major TaxID=103 RepID=UPI0003FCE8AA|nr:hypothetical protein [Flectobacillus major]
MIYWGISAGFANYAPIISLLGSVLVFAIAIPIYVYFKRIGLFIGLFGCLLISAYEIPFWVINLRKVLIEHKFQWDALIFSLPALVTLLAAYLSIKGLFRKENQPSFSNQIIKLILAGVPIALFILYLIFYGKFWNINEFKI